MIDPKLVTPVLVTRGDVDMAPIVESLPYAEPVVWDNSKRPYDAGVFGRYAALAEVTTPVVFFQDDDVVVPKEHHELLLASYEPGLVSGLILADQPTRVDLYKRYYTTLLGWGSIFDRELPWRAFERYAGFGPIDEDFQHGLGAEVVFPMLTTSRILPVPSVQWLVEDDGEVFRRDNRMWRQPSFYLQLNEWLDKASRVRDLLDVVGYPATP